MKYFKNTELAKIYNVSEKSIRNWIQAALEGKNNLELYEKNEKFWIANTSKNTAYIEALVKNGKKYKNQRGRKIIHPSEEFYKTYTHNQILDIISNISIHRETPLQYTYADGGAEDWDRYATRLIKEPTPNILNSTIAILDDTAPTFDTLLESYEKINVVDIGPGNGLPLKPTLERLARDGRLNRYIPIDISADMLKILGKNVKKWFGDSINFEPHIKDISHERFNDVLSADALDPKIVNIVFLLGGTLSNFRSPSQVLQVINDSMGLNDLFVYSSYLDTPKTRRYFDYYTSSKRKVPIQDGLILDLLKIDESLYEVEQIFDEEKRARTISIKPKVDLVIKFKLENGIRTIELLKNEPILIWRHWHKTVLEIINILDVTRFDLMQATKSNDNQYLVAVSRIQRGS